MALTLDRWLGGTVAGCLVALVLVAGSDAPTQARVRVENARARLDARASRAANAVRIATERLQLEQLRDSVKEALARLPNGRAERLVVSERIPERAHVTRNLNARLAGALPAAPKVGVDLVITAETMPRGSYRSTYNYQLLPAGPNARCVAISGAYATRDVGARDWIGPCGFYATYGVPGPNIDRWLQSGGWIFGTRWKGAGRAGIDEGLLYYWYYPRMLWREAAGFPVRSYLSALGYSCLTGNRAACHKALLEPNGSEAGVDAMTTRAIRNKIRLGRGTVWSRPSVWWATGLLGPQMENILVDMSSSLGPERFQRFWTSDLAPADAFRAASGQDIDDWTAEWMRSTYGAHGSGPHVTLSAATLGVLLAVLALGGASVTWRRRQAA